MNIVWHGLSCFEIETKTPAGEASVIVDPYGAATGLRVRNFEAPLVLISHEGTDTSGVVGGSPFVIRRPGEYEAKAIFAYGIAAPTKAAPENVIYRIESEEMYLAHLGALDRELTNGELEQMKNIDILFVPVGGGRVLTPKLAAEVVNQVEPRVVIPMTYATDGLKEELAAVSEFFKALGVPKPEETPKFKIAKKDLPQDDMKVVLLSRD